MSETPIYNLKAVLTETGLAADTLRAWERRYGLPKPQRTPGGHRLYSEHDIQLIKWLLARQAEGLSISRAVDRWNNATATGEDPLAIAAQLPAQRRGSAETSLDALRQEWLTHGLNFNEFAAEQVLHQAFALFPVETVVSEVIRRGLREVGDRWQHQRISVQQEHFVSGLAARRLDALIEAAPPPTHPAAIVLACPPAELHSLPLLHLTLMLRRHGRNVILLGADVPTSQLEQTARTVRAALVVLSAQRLTTAAQLRHAAGLLAKQGIRVGYGGRVFNHVPELQPLIAGEFLGAEIETAIPHIEALLQRAADVRHEAITPPDVGAEVYRRSRSQMEAVLQKRLVAQADPAIELAIANNYFGGALAAALELGDVAYLASDMDWIDFLLTKPHMPFVSSRNYLLAYAASIREVMGAAGTRIAEWLESRAANGTGEPGT